VRFFEIAAINSYAIQDMTPGESNGLTPIATIPPPAFKSNEFSTGVHKSASGHLPLNWDNFYMKRKFDTGAIRDSEEGKPDFVETISFTAHHRYAMYMTSKKKTYGEGNFKKGIPIEAYEKSLLRHIDKYFRNKYENGNDEPNEDHLAAIRFNVDGIMHEEGKATKK